MNPQKQEKINKKINVEDEILLVSYKKKELNQMTENDEKKKKKKIKKPKKKIKIKTRRNSTTEKLAENF